jgi:hypothetical protein
MKLTKESILTTGIHQKTSSNTNFGIKNERTVK